MCIDADEAVPNGDEAVPIPVYEVKANQLEILRIGYDNQLQYLRLMSDLDVKIFTGYITAQLVVATWVGQHPLTSIYVKWGLFLVDIAFTVLAIIVLHYNQKRRNHSVTVLRNLSEALGFTTEGVFLAGRAIHPGATVGEKVPRRPWIRLYYTMSVVSAAGIGLIIFGS
jgi:hypothetical protein